MFKNLKTLPSAEECGEAVQAALKYDYRADEITKQALITEIADLEIMVQQIKSVIGYDKVNKEIDFKLNRQLEICSLFLAMKLKNTVKTSTANRLNLRKRGLKTSKALRVIL